MSDLKLIISTVVTTVIFILIAKYLLHILRNNITYRSQKNFLSAQNVTNTDHNKKYNELVEIIDEYEQHQENNSQKETITQLKIDMKNMLSQSHSYEERIIITTYFIENIFNVLNNKKTITFKEFYNILSNQIYKSKSVDPAFKTYLKNRNSGINI